MTATILAHPTLLEQSHTVDMNQILFNEIMSLAREVVKVEGLQMEQAISKAADMVESLEQFANDWDGDAWMQGNEDAALF